MIKLQNVNKFYNKGKSNQIHVLNEINLDLGKVGFVAILGPSGSGKTTLLNALGGLDKIDNGLIQVENQAITKYRHYAWDDLRNQYFGYIFQNYHLFGDQTVFQNVAFSLEMLGIKDKEVIKTRVLQALAIVKMDKYKNRLAKNLSGGEQQRVAIARALVKDPKYVIADEPTGNLDRKNTLIIMNILKEIAKTRLVVMVTHEKPLAYMFASRIISISDGKIVEDINNQGSGDLSYVDDRVVYLGDLEHQVKVQDGSVSLEFLSDQPIDINSLNVNLKLIVRGSSIYLKPEVDSHYKLEVVSDDSLLSFQEGHRPVESFDMKEALAEWQPLEDHTKKRFNLSLWRFYKQGFQEIFSISRMKKIILFGFAISSFLLTIALGLYQQAVTVDESDFVDFNRDLVKVDLKEDSLTEAEQAFAYYWNLPGVYGFAKTNLPTITMTSEPFFQNMRWSQPVLYLPNALAYDDNIKIKPSGGEVVLSRGIINSILDDSNFYRDTYYSSEKMIIGQTIMIGNRTFTIKGIEESNILAIYLSQHDFLTFNLEYYSTEYTGYPVFSLSEVETTVTELLANEILISKKNEGTINIGDKFLGYTVKGYFEVKKGESINGIVFSTADMPELIFKAIYKNKANSYYLYSRNPKQTVNAILEKGGYAESLFEKAYESYLAEKLMVFRILLIFVGVMLIAPLLMLYFVMRSNMISRIKEIGIYRALGLRRYNIYKMHLGEVLAITSLFSLSGYLLALFVMLQSNQKIIIPIFKLNFVVVVGSLAIVLIINVIVGLLPVLRLMRNTPQAILSKYDI